MVGSLFSSGQGSIRDSSNNDKKVEGAIDNSNDTNNNNTTTSGVVVLLDRRDTHTCDSSRRDQRRSCVPIFRLPEKRCFGSLGEM